MFKRYIDKFPGVFKDVDFLVITDKDGYIESYKMLNSIGNKIVENPVGFNILELHQHLSEETSTIMRVLKSGEPIINERQHLNIFKERTATVITTTFPLKNGNETIGAIDINKYIGVDLRRVHESSMKHSLDDANSLFTIDDILTKNPKMKEVKNLTLKAAKTNSSVMIYGETGTGKELIAQSIHNHSFRKGNPLIVQNCSAIPESLGESIFFGTVKGSFTDATTKMGLFEMANNGTLVLDELNSMDINLQAKLLRTTENNFVRRVGGSDTINVDVKIVSILSEEPYVAIEQNRLRQDLFYRLGIVTIHIPPLRERKEDIPLLVDSFIDQYNATMNKDVKGIDKKAQDLLIEYNWPGNIRELKHIIERAFNLIEGKVITSEQLPHYIKSAKKEKNFNIKISDKISLTNAVSDYEKKYIQLALESSDTLNEAAKLLKVSRQTLKYKLDTYGLGNV